VLFLDPAGIGLLNLWNDFRKVVKFIDENQTWLRPLMGRIAANKKAEEK
jgi:hypothetical protein